MWWSSIHTSDSQLLLIRSCNGHCRWTCVAHVCVLESYHSADLRLLIGHMWCHNMKVFNANISPATYVISSSYIVQKSLCLELIWILWCFPVFDHDPNLGKKCVRPKWKKSQIQVGERVDPNRDPKIIYVSINLMTGKAKDRGNQGQIANNT